MTKLSSRSIDKTARVKANEAIRRVRNRYYAAVELGHSKEDAAKMAEGDGPISAPQRSDEPMPQQQKQQPEAKVSAAKLSGKAAPAARVRAEAAQPKPKEDIPPNWQDLPWPQLKNLALRLSGGKNVRSRDSALEMIQDSLAKSLSEE